MSSPVRVSPSAEDGEPGGIPRAVLLTIAAVFVAFGVAFLLAPDKLGSYVDLSASVNTGRTELRAVYGGLELGLGVFFALSALRKNWHVPALVAALLAFIGLAGARIYGISVEGGASIITVLTLLSEIAGAVASAWALVRTRKPDLPSPEDDLASKFEALEKDMRPKRIEKTKPIPVDRTVPLDRAKK